MPGLLGFLDNIGTSAGEVKGLLGSLLEELAARSQQGLLDSRAALQNPNDAGAIDRSINSVLNAGGLLAMPTVYHGTQAVRRWYDLPEWKNATGDIPPNVGESTYALEKVRGGVGGLKMMDGLGPHFGTPEAANHRLASNVGASPSKGWDKFNPQLENSYVMPFDLQPQKPFTKASGEPYTETELQSRLSSIAKSLGFKDTRAYSSAYGASSEMKAAQRAVKQHLLDQGYDAIPYINSHEARGSTSWVVLNPESISPLYAK